MKHPWTGDFSEGDNKIGGSRMRLWIYLGYIKEIGDKWSYTSGFYQQDGLKKKKKDDFRKNMWVTAIFKR